MKLLFVFFFFCIEVWADIGSVVSIRGDAMLTRHNAVYKLKKGDKIEVGDTIDTYKKSIVQIVLNDNTKLTLGQKTSYKINNYNDTNNPQLQTELLEGLVTTISGKIGKIAPKRFKLKTATATIGIRGTKWKTFVYKRTHYSLCLKGEIVIVRAKKLYTIPRGYMFIIKNDKAMKLKANMSFFEAMIKKIQSKQKIKPKKLPSNSKSLQQSLSNRSKITNSNISTDVKTRNIDVSQKGSAKVGNIAIEED